MLIRAGFDIRLSTATELPLLVALAPYPGEVRPVFGSADVHTEPALPITSYRDLFGNHIGRITMPPGDLRLVGDLVVHDSGEPEPVVPEARACAVPDLPAETLVFLLPSRYVESDLLSADAWALFGHVPAGWARVQAVCDFVHNHIRFGYECGRATKTALEAFREGAGVCRDFAHLSLAFCRALNIPARYVSGYLGDIGVPPGGPMDFCAWFEVWLEGQWFAFDARYNMPRIGRIPMVRGRDAADVAMITSFGPHLMTHFEVWCDELPVDVEPANLRALMQIPEPRLLKQA